jgi:hypothetical protein
VRPGQVSTTRKPGLARAGRSDLAELAPYANVKRVIITGPGAAGKSALAVRLGEITGLPVMERRRSRPLLLQAIAAHAGDAEIHVLRTPQAVRRFVARIASGTPDLP